MLGAVSPALPFATETWEAVIRKAVPPKSIDVNLEAFRLGVTGYRNDLRACPMNTITR
jgi:indolepyruvate ferredoxin oxidoreductase beta subunit